MAAAREAWRAAAPRLRPEDLVFVAESGVATNMVRRYGRAPGGRRVRASVPRGAWERLTILGGLTLGGLTLGGLTLGGLTLGGLTLGGLTLGGLTLGGLTLGGLTACLAAEGATDARLMRAFVRHALVPTLRPGQVVVLDHLSAHRDAAVRRRIEGAGCTLLFLPAYSPDFNPIEPAWSKLKTLLRGVGARTTEALHAALAALVDAITPGDAAGYFRHCGYAR